VRPFLVATLMLFLIAPSQAAAFETHRDPDDTSSLVDFRKVKLAHRHDPNRAVILVRRYEARHPDLFRIRAYIDSRGDDRADYMVETVFDRSSGGWVICDVNPIRRGDLDGCSQQEHARTVRFTFAWSLLHADKVPRWRLVGKDWSADIGHQIVDRAPDHGFYAP
jgi:hypothetical protein